MDAAHPGTSEGPRPCMACGYSLVGIPDGNNCPECGAPEPKSYRGWLVHSSEAYVRLLRRSLDLVIAGTIGSVFTVVLGIVGGFVIVASGASTRWLTVSEFVLNAVGVLAAIVVAIGWWLFSTPDPVLTGRFDGGAPRRLVRVCVIANLLFAGIALVPSGVFSGLPLWTSFAVGGVGIVVTVVTFYAQVLYLRWTAPRIPRPDAYRFAGVLLWLGPTLYVVGFVCLCLGPVAAFVLFVILLFKVRTGIATVAAEQARAAKDTRADTGPEPVDA